MQVLQESAGRQASHVSWMKSHLKGSQQDDNEVIGIIRRWHFIKRKVNVTLKKIVDITGGRDLSRNIVGLRIWLDEAESFMKYHSKESRNTQEMLKIKVFVDFYIITSLLIV